MSQAMKKGYSGYTTMITRLMMLDTALSEFSKLKFWSCTNEKKRKGT